jgi:hypothetical protein
MQVGRVGIRVLNPEGQLSTFGRNVALFAERLYVSSGFTVVTLEAVVGSLRL